MPEPSRLQLALADACEIARAEGVEATPADFAIQRSDPGWQHATHVAPEIVISVSIDPDGMVGIAVGEIEWFAADGDVCPNCGADASTCECEPEEEFVDQYRGRLCTTVPLPGDGTPPPTPGIPPYACRDAHGAIRRARDGLFIADAATTADELRARIAKYDGDDTAYANTVRTLYRGALEVITAEVAEVVSVDA